MPIPTFEEFRKKKYGASYQPISGGPSTGGQLSTDPIQGIKEQYLQAWKQAPIRAAKGQLSQNDISTAFKNATGLDLLSSSKSPSDVISEVMKQGGSGFVSKGRTKEERQVIAQEILDVGGVKEYRKIVPIQDLSDDKEKEGITSATDLLIQIDMALPNFKKENLLGGTGPFAGRLSPILDVIGTPEGREARATPEQVRASYQQLISGKVVSEQEARRLKAFLPTKDKTETQNAEDLERLKFRINLNMELFEKGKREGLNINESYKKYGQQMIEERFNERFGQKKEQGQLEKVLRQSSGGAGPIGALALGPPELKAAAVAGPVVGAATMGVPALIKALSPAAIGAARDVAQKNAPDVPTEAVKTVKEIITRYTKLDPSTKDIGKEMLQGLKYAGGKVNELEDLAEAWNKAYTARGDVRYGKEAYNIGKQALKQVIEKYAPEVAKQTGKFRMLKTVPEVAKNSLTTTLKLSALGRLLGL